MKPALCSFCELVLTGQFLHVEKMYQVPISRHAKERHFVPCSQHFTVGFS